MQKSQFVILTPFQRQAHGCKPAQLGFSFVFFSLKVFFYTAELYKAIYQYVTKSLHIAELTVEDPAEAFEDLRDKNDLQLLLSNEQFLEEGYGRLKGLDDEVGIGIGIGSRARKSGRAEGESEIVTNKDQDVGRLGPPADKRWVEKWRRDLKIAGV